MSKIIHDLQQGSDTWHAHRAMYFNASEAAAMLGVSPYMTRDELLKEKHLGIVKEVSPEMQHIFDKGHEYEAMARPWAEELIGEDLYPTTMSCVIEGLKLSASFDGITMDESTIFEHKTMNKEILDAHTQGKILDYHAAQMAHQLIVSDAYECLFMASNGDKSTMIYQTFKENGSWRQRIIAGWKQFSIDLANYQHMEILPALPGKVVMALPALTVRLIGEVTESNLALYKDAALNLIGNINTTLETDQDFADAEVNIKDCDRAEKELELVKRQALTQTKTIDELFRTVDMLRDEMRGKRLQLEKLVKVRKESIRSEIMQEGVKSFNEHIIYLNERLGSQLMPTMLVDFSTAMKNKKTVSSLRDAMNSELARAKIVANDTCTNILGAQNLLMRTTEGYEFLFPDTAKLVLKSYDDLQTTISLRINEHKTKEEKRIETEREHIRNEELAKIERERIEVECVPVTHKSMLVPAVITPITKAVSAPITLGWQAQITDLNLLYEFVSEQEGFEHWIKVDFDAIKQYAASTRGTCPIPGLQFTQLKKEA